MEYKIAVLKGDGIGPEIVDVTTTLFIIHLYLSLIVKIVRY